MTLAEAQKTAMSILKQVMEEKLNNTNVEVATLVPVDSEIELVGKCNSGNVSAAPTYGKFHRLATKELDEIIATL